MRGSVVAGRDGAVLLEAQKKILREFRWLKT